MAQPSKHIFILAGGSNMAGRGGVDKHNQWDGDVPPQCAPQPTKIYSFNADFQWEVATEPLHKGIDKKNTCGVGPGMAFANSVKKYMGDNYVIGLVPCAAAETTIKEWGRGTPLFENLVKRVKAAVATSIPSPTPASSSGDSATSKTTTTTNASCTTMYTWFSTVTSTTTASPTATATQAVTSTATSTSTSTNPAAANGIASGSGNEIKALLWYQGESDAKSDENANSYRKKMEELIANIREDLKLPGLPVIQVAIPSGDENKTNTLKIRKAQLEMEVENTECVDANSKGLTLKDGNLTSQAQVKLGEMLAIKYCDRFAG